MSNVLFWIRDNLLLVICVAVMLISVGVVFVVAGAQSADFQKELEDAPRVQSQIRSFSSQTLTIPTVPPEDVRTAINEKDVEALENIFSQMNGGYDELVKAAREFNMQGGNGVSPHNPLAEDLFPLPKSDSVLYDARDAYFKQCQDMYKVIRAGVPPSAGQIAAALEEVKRRYERDREVLPTMTTSSVADPELLERQAREKLKMILNRARSLRIYAEPLVIAGDVVEPGIFQVGEWATQEEKPDMDDVWEGQMQAWIQQDLVLSIWLANTADAEDSAKSCVLDVPVKRILSLSVEPEYIGLKEKAASVAPGTTPVDVPIEETLNKPLSRNFVVSPTGRVTNPLFDVRHARMSVIIDPRDIPRLLNAITSVNLMTPIVEKIVAVDQADHFNKGYVYGDRVEVVQLDLLVESLWLRNWTAGSYDRDSADRMGESFEMGLMPDAVRAKLNLPTRDPNFVADGAKPLN